jgi:DNA-binding response OmpR family regulator
MMQRNILIIDDERELRDMLRAYLTAEGFSVQEAADGSEGLRELRRSDPDLVILDVGLPSLDGFEVLQALRLESSVPVIMLTARAEEIDRVVGLSAGADDYVTKPFSPRELTARISAVLRRRRADTPSSEVLAFDELVIDISRREVRRGEALVEVSALEFDLLVALARAPGRVFSRGQLLEMVWGWDFFGVDRVVDVHIGNLRKALGDDAAAPDVIGTVRGVGYKLVATPQ